MSFFDYIFYRMFHYYKPNDAPWWGAWSNMCIIWMGLSIPILFFISDLLHGYEWSTHVVSSGFILLAVTLFIRYKRYKPMKVLERVYRHSKYNAISKYWIISLLPLAIFLGLYLFYLLNENLIKPFGLKGVIYRLISET